MRESCAVHVRVAGAVLVLCLTAWPGAVCAQPDEIDLWEGNPALAKVSSHLLRARALAADDKSASQIAAAVPSLKLRDGLAVVEVRLERLTPDLVEELRGRGMFVDSFHLGYARAYGRLDPADLDKIAALPEVVTIQPMPIAFTRVGVATNQADVTMNADDVRATLGYDGTDVKVGILSDSFRTLAPVGTISGTGCNASLTGTSSQISGDLPNGANDIIVLDNGPGGSTDEGRAIAELIWDVAPGAQFSFHSAFNSPADFADGITELVDCGADLIVDDVGWSQQAFFQDGKIAYAAQMAVDNGVPYVSAAGNDATFGVHDTYTDSTPASDDPCTFPSKVLPNGNDLHDFGGGDSFAAITLPNDCDLYAELQWAEPFQSLGAPGPGAPSDLDLYLLDSPDDPFGTDNIVDFSTTRQGCGFNGGPAAGDPVEFVSYFNDTGVPQTVFLAVDHCCGDESLDFRIVNVSFLCGTTGTGWDFEDGFDIDGMTGLPVPDPSETPILHDPQIYGHPAAKGVIAVGATFYGEIDGGGGFLPGEVIPPTGQFDVEPFSSLGGDLPFFFDESGNPLMGAPQTRFKPEVTAPDGVNNTFFGIDFGFDTDTDPNFSGTSASAPNAAAVAVLLLHATNREISPIALWLLVWQTTGADLEGTGPDPLSGFGLIDALKPIRSLDSTTTPLIDDLEFDLDGGAFFSSPPSPPQRLQANDSLFLEDGDFSGIDGLADTLIFADGFESGDTSAWSN